MCIAIPKRSASTEFPVQAQGALSGAIVAACTLDTLARLIPPTGTFTGARKWLELSYPYYCSCARLAVARLTQKLCLLAIIIDAKFHDSLRSAQSTFPGSATLLASFMSQCNLKACWSISCQPSFCLPATALPISTTMALSRSTLTTRRSSSFKTHVTNFPRWQERSPALFRETLATYIRTLYRRLKAELANFDELPEDPQPADDATGAAVVPEEPASQGSAG